MRVAVLDAFAGVAGDMWVGALLDAGVPFAPLADAVRALELPGVAIRSERVRRGSLVGTRFAVDTPAAAATAFAPLPPLRPGLQPAAAGHCHRDLAAIEAIVRRARLPGAVEATCLEVYRSLGGVEAEAHGVPIEQVHFHEVGAEDTIVDVVCACLGTHLLAADRLVANGIAVGSGTVQAAHGLLPVPAPATAALLRGIPVRLGTAPGERTTPTGAALLRTLVHAFDEPLTFVAEAIGYGAGTRDDAELPNLLRLSVGRLVEPGAATDLVEISCQLDTATGEQVGWLVDELLRRGAVDAFTTSVGMKKGRPGLLVTVLCDPVHAGPLGDLLLEESSSLGVRQHRVQRRVLSRWIERRPTQFGEVVFKVARLPSGAVVGRPEDDELQRLARETGLGRAEILRRLLP